MPRTAHVTPDRWTPRGEARVEGRNGRKPMVVWGGIPGEKARVRVLGAGQHQARAEWVDARVPHADRVEPPCDRYAPCGGCAWMHLRVEAQERNHRELVRAALAQHGLDDVGIDRWHPSPGGMAGYRHVVKVGIARNEIGKTKIGAWGRHQRRIVPIPQCVAATPVLRRTMASLAHHVLALDVWPWEPDTDRGVLRAAVMRASRASGQVLVTLVAARPSKRLRDLAEAVGGGVPEVCGVWVHFNGEPGNAIFHRDEDGAVRALPVVGAETVVEELNGVAYRIGPGDFFQTHPAMAEVLYARAMDALAPGPDDAVLDLYCGVGGLALQAARRGAGFVLGVEEVHGAVARARTSARQNRLRAEFTSGRVGEVLLDVAQRLAGVAPLVTVNPARRGLEDGVCEQIAGLGPRRVVYVSCNPSALARDLARFRRLGLQVRGGIELFDMFPHTPHVECLAVLDGIDAVAPTRRAPRRRVVRRRG